MNDGVIYNVKTIIRTDTTNEEELRDIFNAKLLKLIISFENSRVPNGCQM